MLELALIFTSSAGVAAAVTAVMLRFRSTRVILKLLQVTIILGVAAYAASFFVFYRPEIWLQVASEIISGAMRVDTKVLTGLGGLAFGTLITQKLITRRNRK